MLFLDRHDRIVMVLKWESCEHQTSNARHLDEPLVFASKTGRFQALNKPSVGDAKRGCRMRSGADPRGSAPRTTYPPWLSSATHSLTMFAMQTQTYFLCCRFIFESNGITSRSLVRDNLFPASYSPFVPLDRVSTWPRLTSCQRSNSAHLTPRTTHQRFLHLLRVPSSLWMNSTADTPSRLYFIICI